MRFTPEFLDEIRARVSVSEVVGKHTPVVRQGRECLALCPFHNDTKPSLHIVDSKNFYHCFACGASGDIFAFVMGTERLGFPETVSRLAGMAGLALPDVTPEDRERTEQRRSLLDVMEAACVVFERNLRSSEGRAGLDYLYGRQLTDETIARFRLGYARGSGSTLRRTLAAAGISNDAMLEVGLVRQPEDDRAPYDYFRDRIMFPITDRQGRVIAFGGRTLGDGQPKYLNSPDTPLFHKGRILYGRPQASDPAIKTGEIIVTEGYMDVIALAQGGLPQVVAPLGTALTEDQITDLWRLVREPIVCFDGDEAGRRAAIRASERALPILKPGHSLRFVSLPSGQDPDDLMARDGKRAMRELLDRASALSDFVWDVEFAAQSVNTPERMADFTGRIRNRVRAIAERTVQEAYRDTVEARLRDLRQRFYGSAGRTARPGRFRDTGQAAPQGSESARARVGRVLPRRQYACILAVLVNHPELIDEFGEELGACAFEDPHIDRLRQDILEKAFSEPDLDAAALRNHLRSLGYDEECGGMLGAETLRHAAFARAGASLSDARAGLSELLTRVRKHHLEHQLRDARETFRNAGSELNWNRVSALTQMLREINAGLPDEAGC